MYTDRDSTHTPIHSQRLTHTYRQTCTLTETDTHVQRLTETDTHTYTLTETDTHVQRDMYIDRD